MRRGYFREGLGSEEKPPIQIERSRELIAKPIISFFISIKKFSVVESIYLKYYRFQ
jgi:hypothetical protein